MLRMMMLMMMMMMMMIVVILLNHVTMMALMIPASTTRTVLDLQPSSVYPEKQTCIVSTLKPNMKPYTLNPESLHRRAPNQGTPMPEESELLSRALHSACYNALKPYNPSTLRPKALKRPIQNPANAARAGLRRSPPSHRRRAHRGSPK